jgi:hypothetical protein
MLIPLIVLSFFSTCGGLIFKNIFIYQSNWLIEELPIYWKLLPFIIVILVSVGTIFFLFKF